MSTTKLTKIQKTLLSGLKLFQVQKENAVPMVAYMQEEDQIMLIHYMKTHPEATEQEILNESGRILTQRKKLTESSND